MTTDEGVRRRRVTYRLYPSRRQREALESHLRLHAELYNAALQERRGAWRRSRVSIRKGDQEKQLPEIKKERHELKVLGGHALQETLRRVDLAFQAFFRRVKAGQAPGYPRFKSWKRYGGWTYKSSSNWAFEPGKGGRHEAICMDGIGRVRIRGKARQLGEVKTCTIVHRRGRWYASIVMKVGPRRARGAAVVGFDWGISSFLTFDDGAVVANPRYLASATVRLRRAQRDLSRKKRGSRNRRKAAARLVRLHESVANRRTDFLHQESARLVGRSRLLATEKLQVRNMTRSARGTVEAPGRNVRQKAGLNRNILDGAPSAFLAMVRYKAEEAGVELVEVPTRSVKPSQTCPACGAQRPKTLSQRVHRCPCGCVMPRDQASAQVCLHHALSRVGNRPGVEEGVSPPMKHETASELAQAGLGGR